MQHNNLSYKFNKLALKLRIDVYNDEFAPTRPYKTRFPLSESLYRNLSAKMMDYHEKLTILDFSLDEQLEINLAKNVV